MTNMWPSGYFQFAIIVLSASSLFFSMADTCWGADSEVDLGNFFETERESNKSKLSSADLSGIKWDSLESEVAALDSASSVDFQFSFVNQNVFPIRVVSVDPSCGCTEVDFDHEPCPTGARSRVRAVLQLGTATGKIRKRITVKIKGVGNLYDQSFELNLHTTVKSIFTLASPIVIWRASELVKGGPEEVEGWEKSLSLQFANPQGQKVVSLKPGGQPSDFIASMKSEEDGCVVTMGLRPGDEAMKSDKAAVGYFYLDVLYPDGQIRAVRVKGIFFPAMSETK